MMVRWARESSAWVTSALLILLAQGCEQPCVLNTECSSAELCREGSCLTACASYYDCGGSLACYKGACQAPPEGYCERRAQIEAMSEEAVTPMCEPVIVDMGDMGDPDMGGVDMGGVDTGGVDMGGVEMGGVEIGGVDMGGVNMGGVDIGGVDVGGTPIGGMITGGGPGGGAILGGAQVGGTEGGVGGGQTTGGQAGATAGGVEGGADAGTDAGHMGGTEGGMSYQVSTSWLFTQEGAIYQSPTGGGPPARWVGRGVNIHDTRSCDACTWTSPSVANVDEVKRRINEAVDVWGATLLRLNLESYVSPNGRLQSLGLMDDQAYLGDLEEIVRHIGSKDGVYVILAPWKEPLLSDEGWPTDQSEATLRVLARTFYSYPHVIYAVAHEPRQNVDGAQDEACWEAMNSAVGAIREEEAALGASRHIIAVQGTRDLGRDLSYYIDHPITSGDGANILYETHIFNPQSELVRLLVNPAQSLPVLIGAFGPSSSAQRQMSLDDTRALIAEAERQRVSWAAWTFHMRCQPSSLLVDLSDSGCGVSMPLQPTEWGQVIQDQLNATP